MTRERWVEIGRIIFVGVISLFYWQNLLPLPVLLVAVAAGLYPLMKTGVLDLVRERKIGTEIFVTVATIVALLGGEYVAGAVLMCIILIAEFIADLNTDRARASIKALIGSVPQTAIIRKDSGERQVPISELKVGDIVLARAGEKIPVDGTVVGGEGSVNEASITGESVPIDKHASSSVLAGTLVESGALDIRTDKVGKDTMFARIIQLVEEAEDQQAPVQKLADRVAAWLIPIVFIFLIGVFLVTRDVRKVVTLLIFTSPAELGLATPLVMIAAIARAARNGILIKGGVYLETLAKVNLLVFDKTGTLTVGKPEVVSVRPLDPALSEADVLLLAATADRRSGHPLAQAVVAFAAQRQLALPEPTDFEVLQGRGVRATVNNKTVLVGNAKLLTEHGVEPPAQTSEYEGITIFVAADSKTIGILELADKVQPGAKDAIARLKASGIHKVVMLTGDTQRVAQRVGADLGVDEVEADLLPGQKVEAVARLQTQGYQLAMVGDGINDAPALVKADVGIAMGARGTQAALEAADITLMTDDLGKIATARALARRSYRTIQENLFVGVGVVHVLGITAALMGWIGPIQAAILHLGPDILVFLNSVKLLRVRVEGAS
ncbi:MAG: cadmium-translocating P-type ATPase [Bryobacterales bacterium]|nr:cadmium-translocating P-type ATPase [Bryobacterales bacterium]